MNAATVYTMRLRDGSIWELDAQGRVIRDGSRGMMFAPSDRWRIVGFGTRFNSTQLVSLAQAADGRPLGHGFVHDVDHGSRRMWASPSRRRATKLERVTP